MKIFYNIYRHLKTLIFRKEDKPMKKRKAGRPPTVCFPGNPGKYRRVWSAKFCACGCGKRVLLGAGRKPNKFIYGHQSKPIWAQFMEYKREKERRADQDVRWICWTLEDSHRKPPQVLFYSDLHIHRATLVIKAIEQLEEYLSLTVRQIHYRLFSEQVNWARDKDVKRQRYRNIGSLTGKRRIWACDKCYFTLV